MGTLEKFGSGIGVLVAILALTDAFQGFVAGGLFWKMIVIGLTCAFAAWAVTPSLASWVKRRPTKPSYGGSGSNGKRSSPIAIFALFFLCAIFFGLAWLLASWQPIRIKERFEPASSTTLIIASATTPAGLTVRMPNRADTNCRWTDASTGEFPRLDYQVVDMSSPTPKLHFDGFISPQRMQIECQPATKLRDFTLESGSGEIFLQDELNWRLILAVIIGGIIWVAASYRLWVLSR